MIGAAASWDGAGGMAAQTIDSSVWLTLENDPAIDGDCGGKFLTFRLQNMPGLVVV